MLLSTLLPTLIHLFIACVGIVTWLLTSVFGQRERLVRFMRDDLKNDAGGRYFWAATLAASDTVSLLGFVTMSWVLYTVVGNIPELAGGLLFVAEWTVTLTQSIVN